MKAVPLEEAGSGVLSTAVLVVLGVKTPGIPENKGGVTAT